MRYLQKFYDRAFDWLMIAGPKVIAAIIVLIVVQWLIRLFNRWFKKILDKKNFDPTFRVFLENIVAVVLQVFLVLSLMQILGIRMTIFAAVITAFGVAAGLALSGTLQNFASGVLILIMKPFIVGDNIVTQGQEGTVSSIQLFYTTVLTFDNKTVIVPNSKLSNEVILNLSRQGKRRIDIELKFNYNTSIEKIRQVLLHALSSFDKILDDPSPSVGVSQLNADSFNITINAWSHAHGFEDNRMLVNERLVQELKNAGLLPIA